MNIERSIVIAFFGNYIVNTVAAGLVALVPAGNAASTITPQYISFIVLASVVIAILAWWYMKAGAKSMKGGVVFGVTGFLVAIATAFVTGVAGVLSQTGSLSAVVGVLPNFWPFIYNWTTLILLGYWVIPAVLVGWYLGRSRVSAPMM